MSDKKLKKLNCKGCNTLVNVADDTTTVFCWKCVCEGKAYMEWKINKHNGKKEKQKMSESESVKDKVSEDGTAKTVFTPKEMISEIKTCFEDRKELSELNHKLMEEMGSANSKIAKREIKEKINANKLLRKELSQRMKDLKSKVKELKSK